MEHTDTIIDTTEYFLIGSISFILLSIALFLSGLSSGSEIAVADQMNNHAVTVSNYGMDGTETSYTSFFGIPATYEMFSITIVAGLLCAAIARSEVNS